MKRAFLQLSAVGALLIANSPCEAAILITQYYEGSSFNKWIEITNTGATDVDLGAGNYNLSLWSNANTEAYKTDGSPDQSLSLSGTLTVGSSFVYSHGSAVLPSYVTATATSSSVINFNGDDSITLWIGASFTTASIVDAIGFTDAGAEGTNNSFVRVSPSPGWNTTSGSTVDDFSSVWTEVSNSTVDNATAGTDERLGYSSVPEPAAALLGSLGLIGLLRRRRA